MFVMLLYFGIVEKRIIFLNFFWPIAIISFLAILYTINRRLYIAGGDVKYLMLVGFYLEANIFIYFLLLFVLSQFFVLQYIRKVKKRRYAAMVPVMFFSVVVVDVFFTI